MDSYNTVIIISPILQVQRLNALPKGQLTMPPAQGGCHFVPGKLLGALGGGEDWGGRASSSDWLARKADLHSLHSQTTARERGLGICRGGGRNSACLGGVLQAPRRRHLGARLDSSLLHSHDHHSRSKGTPWPTKLWCPVGTRHRPGGLAGRSLDCPASCPANDPTVARQPASSPANLAWPSRLPIHRVLSAQLMTMLPAARGTALLRERQQLTTEPAVPDSSQAKNHSHPAHHILRPWCCGLLL